MPTIKQEAGFTLIELMIVVAIIGILAGIAYPAYSEYVKKGRRADAKAGLMSLQLAQEKYRTNCTQYATAIGNPMSCVTGNFTLIGSTSSPDGHYTLSIVSADGAGYSLKATRLSTGAQKNDKCGDFLIDQDGNKSVANAATGYDATTCW